jgi:alpha-tubulin suppressor-like RCC1 family protein
MLRAARLAVPAFAVAGCIGLGSALESPEDVLPRPAEAPSIPDAPDPPRDHDDRSARQSATLVAGGFHACMLREDGRVSCWGLGDFGQLGDGTTRDRTRPVEVVDLDDVVQVSLGLEHSCARLGSGDVRCWGANPFGQLGDGTDRQSSTPVAVLGIDDAIDLQLGDFEACATLRDGAVECWGGNLGGMPIATHPETIGRATPKIEQRSARGRALAVTQEYRCLYGGNGAQCWGDPVFDACNGDDARDARRCAIAELVGVVHMDLDTSFGCAVVDDGAVKCWGSDSYGQTPSAGDACFLNYPEPGCPRPLVGIEAAIRVAVGTWHVCALDAHGGVTCWGANNFGQLGTPIAAGEEARWRDIHGPTPVERWHDVVEIAAGRGFTCALSAHGAVECLGDMAEGRRPRPVRVPRIVMPM